MLVVAEQEGVAEVGASRCVDRALLVALLVALIAALIAAPIAAPIAALIDAIVSAGHLDRLYGAAVSAQGAPQAGTQCRGPDGERLRVERDDCADRGA